MDENESTRSWQARVDEFWRTADDEDPEAKLAAMNALIADRRPDDPSALFELASTYDFLGQEGNAIPLYRRALQGGLDEESAARATVELASSLRNVGEPAEAVALLEHTSTPRHSGTSSGVSGTGAAQRGQDRTSPRYRSDSARRNAADIWPGDTGVRDGNH